MERDERGDWVPGSGTAPGRDDETVIRPAGPGEERVVGVVPPPRGSSAAAGSAPPANETPEEAEARAIRDRTPGSIRAEDTEPYVGLQYIARLFKIVSFLVLIALGLEILLGVWSDGAQALLPLFAEIVQGGVLAAILWGAADVVLLMIDLGHDVRAARVLLGRISTRGEQTYTPGESPPRRNRER
ncbi:MAG TPA: hypothetical protein VF625_14485 [Longimicrobium sp.]